MTFPNKALFDTLRSIAHGSISGTYAAIGGAFTVAPSIICLTNNTDGDMIVSDDPNNTAGKLFLAKGTYKLFDITTNHYQSGLNIQIGTILYVKQSTAPSTGAFYVEIIYAG